MSGKWPASSMRLFLLSTLLLCLAAVAWLVYLGSGSAYGSLVGLPGRERDLQALGTRALAGLTAAVVCEASAVGLMAWLLSPLREPAGLRVAFSMGVAVVADLFTFAVVRGV